MEKGIEPDIPSNRLECRFCNLVFARTDSLNRHIPVCEDRKEYLKNLQDYCKPITPTTINNNCTFNDNRSINNNVNVNIAFCQENTLDITNEDIFQMLKQAMGDYSEDQIRQIAAELVCLLDKKIKQRPENRTVQISQLNSMCANVKTEHGWELMPIDKVINRVIKNTSGKLLEHRKEIEDHGRKNRLTFQGTAVPMTPQIMDEVKFINKNGIYHFPGSSKTAIKINNLI